MIEINLLPEELKKTAAKKMPARKWKIPRRALKKLAVGFFSFLVLLYLGGILGVNLQKSRLEGLRAEWKKIEPQKEKIDAIKNKIGFFQKKISFIEGLTKTEFLWSAKLNSLSDSMVEGVWLKEVSIEHRLEGPASGKARKGGRAAARKPETLPEKTLVIKGCAASVTQEATAVIGKFIQSLQDNQAFFKDFKKIELGSISGRKIKNTHVKDFVLTGTFKRQNSR